MKDSIFDGLKKAATGRVTILYIAVAVLAVALLIAGFIMEGDFNHSLGMFFIEVSAGLIVIVSVFFIIDRRMSELDVFDVEASLQEILRSIDELPLSDIQRDIRAILAVTSSRNLSSIESHLDDGLKKIFGEEIRGMIKNLESGLENKVIRLNDVDYSFKYHYKKTLETYLNSTFLATASSSPSYFWRDQPSNDDERVDVEKAIERFTEKGAKREKMTRIFFITNDRDINDHQTKRLLDHHYNLGVTVYTSCHVRPQLNRYFFIDEERTIGWSAETDARTGAITAVYAIAARDKLDEFYSIYQELMKLDSTKEYIPLDAMISNLRQGIDHSRWEIYKDCLRRKGIKVSEVPTSDDDEVAYDIEFDPTRSQVMRVKRANDVLRIE